MTTTFAAPTPRAWAELGLLGAIWGATFLSVRVALDATPVLWVVAHRVGWAALVLWAVALLRREAVPRDPRVWGALAAMGLLNNVVPFTLQAWAQLHVPSGLVGILNAGTAVFGMLAAALFLADERFSRTRAFGTGLGTAGVVVAIGPAALRDIDPTSLAQLAVVLSTISYALAGVWARLRLRGLSPVVMAAGMLTASTLTMIPMAALVHGAPPMPGARTVGALAYLTLGATAGAYLLYFRVLAMAGSANLLLGTLVVAPVAILLGAVFLGETLAPRHLAGFALLASGLAVIDGRLRLPSRPR